MKSGEDFILKKNLSIDYFRLFEEEMRGFIKKLELTFHEKIEKLEFVIIKEF